MVLALALVLAQSLQPADPLGPIFTNPATLNRYAFFEAFPPSGAGVPAACSTTPPTGAKGETLTFARTGTATCTKTATGGLATMGIANGDLVVMSANVPRIEYDSNGVKGLLVESARTNSTIRSQELSNAAWLQNADSAPRNTTVTADQAVAPDGTTTADQLDLVATSGALFSSRAQSLACPATAQAISVYLKSVTTGDTLDLCVDAVCTSCTHVPGSWTRCVGTAARVAAAQFAIGNMSVSNGGVARNAQSVYVWGLGCENGSYATSYIPTTSAAVTRNAERAFFAGTFPSGPQSLASTRTGPTYTETQVWALTANHAGAGYGLGQYRLAVSYNSLITGAVPVLAFAPTLDGSDRVWMAADGVNIFGDFAGASATVASATTPASVTGLCVGSDCVSGTASSHANGIISRICLDPTPTRCR